MKVTAIKTKVIQPGEDLFKFLHEHISILEERSIVVITSKILSFAQNRFAPAIEKTREEKHDLVRRETDLYLDPSKSKYDIMITIKNSLLAVNAGIDESNSPGQYILWPENLQEFTNQIWQFLRETYKVKDLGVIITDSKTMPLRWGVTGTAVSYCGFNPLIDKRGLTDIFGREMKMTQIQIAEAIAIAAVFEMGESNEQRPLAIVNDFQQAIEFQDRVPDEEEIKALSIDPEDYVYAPLLLSVPWKKGGK